MDREIKHVLREETKKGNQVDLRKLISVFDSKDTYEEIAKRYPELTDDLLHLMPADYSRVQLGQLISAIWSKYLELQGGDVEVQRQLLERDRELFQKDQEIAKLKTSVESLKKNSATGAKEAEFDKILASGRLGDFVAKREELLTSDSTRNPSLFNGADAAAFGFVKMIGGRFITITPEGREFLKWYILNKEGGTELT